MRAPDSAAVPASFREKGTDRDRFFRGEVDKYTWQDKGSSFLPGELIAAFLSAQFRLRRYHHRSTPEDLAAV
jgi:dTDP-4-amino-4,6-dideoxygalactose transaminase